MKTPCRLGLAGFWILLVGLARAQSPFELVASTTDGPPTSAITITASSSSLIDFTNSLIKTQAQFQPLSGRAFVGRTTFLGVQDAITFNVNAAGTNLVFTLAPINYTKTFTGTNSSDLQHQIEDFIKSDGSAVYADFLAAIARQSTVAVTDGNPNSTTASFADSNFYSQGLTSPDVAMAEAEAAETGGAGADAEAGKAKFGGFGIGFNSGQFEAGQFKGSNTDFSITGLNFALGEKVRLVIPIHLNYLTLDDAKVFGGGISLALPIRMKSMTKENRVSWRVTPLTGINARGSEDLASGALLWNVGVANTVDYRVSRKLVVCFVNQLTYHKSIAINFADYHFDPEIDQQIMKNGLRFVTPFGRRLIGSFMIIDTRFLQDAAVDQFTTFGTSLAFRTTKSYNITLGANYDTGDNFKAWSVGLSSAWRW